MQPDVSTESALESTPPESVSAESVRLAESERELAEARRALVESSRAIWRLEAELEGARDAIRQSVGLAVHDDIGQLLTGVAFLAQSLLEEVPAQLAPAVERLVRLVNQSIERAHEIAEGMSPARVSGRSLDEHLEELAFATTQTFRLECIFASPGTFPAIDVEATTHLHSIAREAVTNAVRHARGTVIAIELAYIEGLRVLTVRDNGRGFPDGPRRVGLGLRSMEHRAKELGATLEFRAARGGGVEVRCAW
jgi:two-component system NarL family sensor kinase